MLVTIRYGYAASLYFANYASAFEFIWIIGTLWPAYFSKKAILYLDYSIVRFILFVYRINYSILAFFSSI